MTSLPIHAKKLGMTTILESYLRGEWVKGQGEGSPLVNPATGVEVARASTEGIDFGPAVDFARKVGGPKLRSMTFAERAAMLKGLAKAIHGAREELIEASMQNAGTTRGDAKFDIDGASQTLAYYASVGKKLGDATMLSEESEQITQSARFFGKHVWVPLRGVAVHVNAFNFPAWGLAEKAAVALLAGVPVISKPATATALLSYSRILLFVDDEGSRRGAVDRIIIVDDAGNRNQFDFTQQRVNQRVPESTFRYAPPQNARRITP